MDSDSFRNKEKYEEEVLTEGMIANARLLSSEKQEFDSIIMLYANRLRIIPNGTSKIGRKLKVFSFADNYNYRIFKWPIHYVEKKDDLRDSIFELSNVTTSLFSHYTNERDYIGLVQSIHTEDGDHFIGQGLNIMINRLYTLMGSYTKYKDDLATPNDIVFKDMKNNMRNESSLYDIDLTSFNLVRLLLVASENFPNTNYNKLLFMKKSPINSRAYNGKGDHVVLNDLLYAGKYGKAAKEYAKTFNDYVYPNAFDRLLVLYDHVLAMTRLGRKIDKNIIKELMKLVYLYYGAKYLKMRDNNVMDQKGLEAYSKKVEDAFTSVMKQYDIDLDYDDLRYKVFCEKTIEFIHSTDTAYKPLSKVKESFEPHEKVPKDTTNKVNDIKLKYNLVS